MKQLHNTPPAGKPAPPGALERLFEVGVRLTDGMDRELAKQGLSRARAGVVRRLHQAGPMTQRELSECLGCSPRNVTGLVDALEGAGLVARASHPTDRRATLVTLTGDGASAAAQWEAEYQKLDRALLGVLPSADLTTFTATLDRLLTLLRDAADDCADSSGS